MGGEAVRGAKDKDGKAPHLLAAMITGARGRTLSHFMGSYHAPQPLRDHPLTPGPPTAGQGHLLVTSACA